LRREVRLPHNLTVTDDSTDGRPWPIDPIHQPTPKVNPVPVPELARSDDPLGSLADFASAVDASANGATNGAVNGAVNGATNGEVRPNLLDAPPSTVAADGPMVSDDDRTRYGMLLDRAAERGLLSADDYQVKLGELADATSIDQMNMIVSNFPALTLTPSSTRSTTSRRSTAALTSGVALAPRPGGRRRSSPWVLLGVLVFVVLASIVVFYVYAEHLVHSRGAGVVAWSAAARALSALRL
jgi:hypothetical protein